MSKITEKDVRHVALLSRLTFTEEEIQKFTKDLNSILEYIAKLEELDTKNVEPTSHSLKMSNIFRQDEVRPSLPQDDAIANAPDNEGGCFKVPKIIQEGIT